MARPQHTAPSLTFRQEATDQAIQISFLLVGFGIRSFAYEELVLIPPKREAIICGHLFFDLSPVIVPSIPLHAGFHKALEHGAEEWHTVRLASFWVAVLWPDLARVTRHRIGANKTEQHLGRLIQVGVSQDGEHASGSPSLDSSHQRRR